ncbi:hypothetical protein [Bradyrhizobium sp. USDA 4350]
MPKPIQLTNDAFLMLRKAVANLETGSGQRITAADILSAAELVDAEYATVRDADGQIELCAAPAGAKYMTMIDALLTRPEPDTIVHSDIPEQYRWDTNEQDVTNDRRGFGP